MVLVAVSLVFQAEVTLTPGAKMSTQVPKLENEARASVFMVAPTVRASGVRAGEVPQASALSLPAATPKTTPAATARRTASSSDWLAGPPRLMFATAGRIRFWATQSTPATTPAVVPEPWQLST